MNVVIDAGNTRTKIGIFEGAALKQAHVFTSSSDARTFLDTLDIHHAILSRVTRDDDSFDLSGRVKGLALQLTPSLPVPVVTMYSTPETLGADRLAAACGAWSLFPGEPSLSIDCGTCINYEYVSALGEYRGGAISPGVAMRFLAMHTLTDQLPLEMPQDASPLVGDSTRTCLESGVMNGTLEEIKGMIGRYQQINPGIRVILTGGDARFFEKHLKPSIFVAPELVLTGLNCILLHNVPH